MTSTLKIEVSLPKHAVLGARRAVRSGRAKSVSAYVASALEEKVKLDDLASILVVALSKRALELVNLSPCPRAWWVKHGEMGRAKCAWPVCSGQSRLQSNRCRTSELARQVSCAVPAKRAT